MYMATLKLKLRSTPQYSNSTFTCDRTDRQLVSIASMKVDNATYISSEVEPQGKAATVKATAETPTVEHG